MLIPRSIALTVALGCGACNIVSGLTDFSVTADGGTGATGGLGGQGGCAGCGEHIWSNAYSSDGNSRGRVVAADDSGNAIVGGNADTTVDFGGDELLPTFGYDVVVAKLGLLGSHAWSRRFGGEGHEWLRGLALAPGGDVLLVGQFEQKIVFTDTGHEANSSVQDDYDAFLIRLAGGSGETLWAHGYGPATRQGAADVAVAPSGEIVVVGDFRVSISFGGSELNQLEGGDHDDVFVARFGSDGEYSSGRVYGDASDDFARAVDLDADGNTVVVGFFDGAIDFGDGTLTSEASPAAFVAKLRPDGTAVWSKTLPGMGAQRATAVDVDADAIVVAGAFDQEIELGTETHTATEDTLWVAKLDHDGTILWGESYPGATQVAGPGPIVALDSTGNVLLTGPLEGSASFGGSLLTSVTNANEAFTVDAFVAKLDPDGGHLWSQSYGGTGHDYGAGITADFQDNVLVTGTFSDDVSFGKDELKTYGESIFVLKLSH